MAITRCFAAAVFAGLAFALAAPASAVTEMSGHYIAVVTDSARQSISNDWYVTSCGDGCASVAHSPGGPTWKQANVVNGQWTLESVDNVDCGDGTSVPNALSAHYTWDPNTLAGKVLDTYTVPACGNPAGAQGTNTLQLKKAP